MSKYGKMPIQESPSWNAISAALSTLSDQEMHYYQLLYANKLTSVYGKPFGVVRKLYDNRISSQIEIVCQADPSYNFTVVCPEQESDEKVLEKLKLIQAALVSPAGKLLNSCCGLAQKRDCVCIVSFTCPIHGVKCIGSHE